MSEDTILGSGTYGDVLQDQNDPEIAIKTVHFMNIHSAIKEIVILQSLSHPNIIQVKKVELDFRDYLINIYMERFDIDLEAFRYNYSTTQFINRYLLSCLQQVFSAISYLHQNHVIHRDLTPANILVKGSHKTQLRFSLCDFGLAVKQFSQDQISYETSVCTVTYRAPEIYIGVDNLKYTNKVDIWSFGCLLYFLLNNRGLLDYQTCLDLFPQKRQESSLYLAHLYQLPSYSNHLTRLKALKALSPSTCKSIYKAKLQRNVNLKRSSINKYLDLLSDCLTINHLFRPDTRQLLAKYPKLLSHEISDLASSIPSPVPQPGLSLIANLNKDPNHILPQNRDFVPSSEETKVDQLSHLIYYKFLKHLPEHNTEMFYTASFYIASLLLEQDNQLYENQLLELLSDPAELGYVILLILHTLNWTIPNLNQKPSPIK